MNILNLFDKELGSKLRAWIVVALGVATVVTAVLQTLIDNLGVLPESDLIGQISMIASGILIFLGKFTSFGNKVVGG